MSALILILLSALHGARAQTIQSDCTPAEVKALQSAEVINQFVSQGKVHTHDCTPVKPAPDKEYLLAFHVFNARGGYESYMSLFERKGFNEKSVALFKSTMIGFDMFPLLVGKAHRLMFVHTHSDKAKLVLYLNPQLSPSASKLARWEYSYERKQLIEVLNRFWLMEAGVLPKIYDDRGTHRALIESRSVEL